MNSLGDITSKDDLNIRKYKEIKNVKIIDTDKGKFVLKLKNKDENGLYQYLGNKHFDYLINKEELDDYNIFPYINEVEMPNEEKAIDLVYILSLLHNKTTFYREVVLDEVKKNYEELSNKIDYMYRYYHDLQDVIEKRVYMSPGQYLLIRNMSLVYSTLDFSKQKLDEWYKYKVNQKKERVVLIHNRPSLDHLLVGEEKKLISWDSYKRDLPIYDFLYFYRINFLDVEMDSLFELYQSKFYFTKDEYLLFLVLLTIPDKVVFTKNHFEDSKAVYKFTKYLSKTRDFILKENEKYQDENKNEFQEQ